MGEWGGSAVVDECDVCEGDGSSCNQPIVNSSAVTVEEDGSVNFDLNASDPTDDALTIAIASGPSHGALDISGLNVTYTPDNNYFGSDAFTFSATDGVWTSGSATVEITVIGINDPPTATGFDIVVSAGSSVDLNPYVDDPDGDPITIVSIPSIDAPNLTTAFGGSLELGESGEYIYNLPPFETATDFLLFKADDGTTQSAMAFGSLSVDAEARDTWRDRMNPPTAFNDAAVLQEDNTQEMSFNAFDPFFSIDLVNGLSIEQYPSNGTLSDITLSAGSTAMLATWTANYNPDDDFNGTDEVKFTVTNTYGTSTVATVSITVNAVNDLPVLADIDDVEFDEDGSTSVSLSYSDVDSDVSVSASSDSNDISVSVSGSTLTIDSSDDYFGSSSVTVTVSDEEVSVSQTFFVNVNTVNDAPVITSTAPDGDVELGSSFEYQVGASDVDDASLSYSLTGNPDGMTISGGGFVSWTPSDIGSYTVTVSVSDGEASADQSFDVAAFFLDCAGTVNGSAVEDMCGTCDSDTSNDCVQDCAGTWGGSLVDDECGICGGDNSSCSDCAGVPNGESWESDCGCVAADND